jgi:hypothetical protein
MTGRNQGDIFQSYGLSLVESNNDRKAGWLAVKELLHPRGEYARPMLKIFSTCTKIIKHLPMLIHDDKDYGDVKTEPHEITHSPDSLRYFAIYWVSPASAPAQRRVKYRADHLEDWRNASESERKLLIKRYGGYPEL